MIKEYHCPKCGKSFVGDGAEIEEHYSNPDGDWENPCGGMGELVATYLDPPKETHE